jgi:NADH-quinone oxidoreductase subunit D
MTLEAAPTTRVELDYSGGERLTMNMGPQHPSAHGVFRAILTLEGETVVAVDAVIGYLHRCHEKLSETLTYAQYPSIASKTDYVAAMTSEFAYVMAAETIGKIEVPKRAQYLRVIAAELQRIASHLLWLGTWCMDMGGALGGGATIFLYAIRERETILDLFESLVGARLLYGFYQVGGTRYDIPSGWADACRKTIDVIDQRIGEYEGLLEDNPFFLARAQGVGYITRELAEDVGIAGPCARLGVNFDLRKSAPYSSYEDFSFTVPVETRVTAFARYRVRMVEFRESIKIVVRRSTSCRTVRSHRGRAQVCRADEDSEGRGLRACRRPARRGRLLSHRRRQRQTVSHEMAWRVVLESRGAAAHHPGHKVADVVAIMGSVDPVFGEVDR